MKMTTKSHPPFFSILTASFNRRATIQETLESVKNQTFRNFEHIIVDGGSVDGTIDVLKEYQESYQLKCISEPDTGISDALNKGVHLAKGFYIFVLQADDSFFDRFSLEKAHRYIIRHSADIFSFPVILKNAEGKEKIVKPIRLIWYNHLKFIFHHQGCIVKRTVFKRVGDFNKQFLISMDYDFFYRALKLNVPVCFGSFPIARMNSGGVSSMILERIAEERSIQKLNENSVVWRMAQVLFGSIYFPYKRFRISRREYFPKGARQ